jgi:hypothetical protein
LLFAETELGKSRAHEEIEKFKDHWQGKAGLNALKVDWTATWRTWVRRADEFAGDRPKRIYANAYAKPQKPTLADLAREQAEGTRRADSPDFSNASGATDGKHEKRGSARAHQYLDEQLLLG